MATYANRILQSSLRLHHTVLVIGILGGITLLFFSQLLGDKVFSRGDIDAYFLPYRLYAADSLKAGSLPLWNPFLFCGVPFLANIQTALFYPLSFPFYIMPGYAAVAFALALHSLLAGLFMYLCMRAVYGLSPFPSFFAAVIFAFSGFMSVHMAHLHYIGAAIWLPLALLCLHRLLTERRLRYAVWLPIVLTAQFFSGGTQLSYYTIAVLGAYWLVILVKEGRGALLRHASVLTVVVVVAAGLSAVQLLPTYELMGESRRAGGVSFAESNWWSIHPAQFVLTLFFPAFFGGQIIEKGSAVISETTTYVGILPLFLASVAALVRPRHKMTVFTLLLVGAAVFFALGEYNPLNRLAYDFLPGFRLFRVPGRTLLIFTFGLAALSGVGLGALLDGLSGPNVAKVRRLCRLSIAVLATITVGFLVVHFMAPSGSLISERSDPLQPSSYQPILAGIVALLLVNAGFRQPRLLPRLSYVILAIAVADLFLFSRNTQYSAPKGPSSLGFAKALHNDGELYRVVKPRQWFSNILMTEQLMDAEGYDGGVLPIQRWQDLADIIPSNPKVLLPLLNVKYSLEPPTQQDLVHYFETPQNLSERQLDDPLPRAFVVHRSKVLDAPGVLAEMASQAFLPAEVVLLEEGPVLDGANSRGGDEVRIETYKPESVRIKVRLKEEGLLVLTDTYYPGWRVTVDGDPKEILRADYLFRAVRLDPGIHEVEFSFVPLSFYIGAGISLLTVLMLLTCTTIFAMTHRRKTKRMTVYETGDREQQ